MFHLIVLIVKRFFQGIQWKVWIVSDYKYLRWFKGRVLGKSFVQFIHHLSQDLLWYTRALRFAVLCRFASFSRFASFIFLDVIIFNALKYFYFDWEFIIVPRQINLFLFRQSFYRFCMNPFLKLVLKLFRFVVLMDLSEVLNVLVQQRAALESMNRHSFSSFD